MPECERKQTKRVVNMSELTVVTGASGHIGANLVRALLEQGRRVRVLVHEDERGVDGLDVERVQGSILDDEVLRRLLDGAETVFHLAARISIVGSENGRVERTNVDGARAMASACLQAGVRRLIHTSSIHAFDSHPNHEVVDERRALAIGPRQAAYDRSKARGQLAVLEQVQGGLDAVIVNPGAVLGPWDFKPSRMGSVILDLYHHDIPAVVDGGYNWVDARDVVQGMLAAEQKGRRGQSYLLTGHWASLTELSTLIGRISGRRTPRLATPISLAWMASWGSLAVAKYRKQMPKFTPAAIRAVRMHRYISHQKASDELGYQPRPLEQTLRDTLDWFARQGMLRT